MSEGSLRCIQSKPFAAASVVVSALFNFIYLLNGFCACDSLCCLFVFPCITGGSKRTTPGSARSPTSSAGKLPSLPLIIREAAAGRLDTVDAVPRLLSHRGKQFELLEHHILKWTDDLLRVQDETLYLHASKGFSFFHVFSSRAAMIIRY